MKKEKQVFYHLKFWPYTAEISKVNIIRYPSGVSIVFPVGSNVSSGWAEEEEIFETVGEMDQYVKNTATILLQTGQLEPEEYLALARTYKAAKDKALQEQLSLDLFGIGGDENV